MPNSANSHTVAVRVKTPSGEEVTYEVTQDEDSLSAALERSDKSKECSGVPSR